MYGKTPGKKWSHSSEKWSHSSPESDPSNSEYITVLKKVTFDSLVDVYPPATEILPIYSSLILYIIHHITRTVILPVYKHCLVPYPGTFVYRITVKFENSKIPHHTGTQKGTRTGTRVDLYNLII